MVCHLQYRPWYRFRRRVKEPDYILGRPDGQPYIGDQVAWFRSLVHDDGAKDQKATQCHLRY